MTSQNQQQVTIETWVGGFVLAILVILGAVVYFRQTAIVEQLKVWKLWPLPEPLTELYLEDHTSLPEKVGKDPISFRFTIHNIEYKDVNYLYRIILDSPQEQRVIDEDTVFLSHEESQTFEKILDPATIATRTAVAVYLPYQDQRIHFWVEPVK